MSAHKAATASLPVSTSDSPDAAGRAAYADGRGGDGVTAFIALGANLGDPAAQIERALEELAALPESRLVARSRLYLSRAVGYAEQPDFVNAVAAIQTRLPPRRLLDALLEIEARHGRRREFKNAPRTLDLDLLLHGDLALHEHGLTLPHPRMSERAFVLRPLAEIAPDRNIPGQGCVADRLAALGPAAEACTIIPRLPSQEP